MHKSVYFPFHHSSHCETLSVSTYGWAKIKNFKIYCSVCVGVHFAIISKTWLYAWHYSHNCYCNFFKFLFFSSLFLHIRINETETNCVFVSRLSLPACVLIFQCKHYRKSWFLLLFYEKLMVLLMKNLQRILIIWNFCSFMPLFVYTFHFVLKF